MIRNFKLFQWCSEHTSGMEFWLLAAGTLLFNLGISIYFFLYSLYLLDLGFTEKTVGLLTSAMVLGGMCGTVPMAKLARRLGLRRVLGITLPATMVMLAVRVCWISYPAQIVSSFLTGAMMCGWMVCLSPGVANAVEEQRRPFAFSVLYATAIVAGCGGALIGGYLPGFLAAHDWCGFGSLLTSAGAKRQILLFGALLIGSAALPLRWMRDSEMSKAACLTWPKGFLKRFLVASAIWSAAVGLINPFAGPLFVRYLTMPVRHTGAFFSVTQLIQAIAVLVGVPWILKRLGIVSGVFGTQFASGIAAALLISGERLIHAEFFYCLFMSAQQMADTGMQALLMNRIPQQDRSDAAALNYLVVALGQSGAAVVGGYLLAVYGYPWMMRIAGLCVIVSSVIFRLMCDPEDSLVRRQDVLSEPGAA